MRCGVVVFPGSNCDHDVYHVLKHVLDQEVSFLWHDEETLKGAELVVLPGGFAYGDYLRAGAMAALSPVMAAVKRHAEAGGLVLGICNGFQVLLEAKLLPGAMRRNQGLRFLCQDVYLKTERNDLPFTRDLKVGQVLRLPIAHAEGNYEDSAEHLDALEAARQVVFRYVQPDGSPAVGEGGEAWNPNGAARAIAGIVNARGNVLGLMPHPERCAEEILGNTDGLKIFQSSVQFGAKVAMSGYGGTAMTVLQEPTVGPELARAQGMTDEEYERLQKILGREPSYTELGITSALWSEHCSYKSSKVYLKEFPTEGPHVLEGPGENAGVVDIGYGWVAVFKMESHNHPSFIEPYQGSMTGVGGILRDVFTMGARPIACMDSLRFGEIDAPRMRFLIDGVVRGIGDYGNCVGIPTVGGETGFHRSYNGNVLVNAFALGVARRDRVFHARASGPGNPILYAGSATGRDGIHGATMASEAFAAESEHKRPTVQVGDPFTEKVLLEACLDAMRTGAVVAIQDMGAAGLTSSSFEMAGRGGMGMRLDLDQVPLREAGLSPYEMMLSESQERMVLVAKRGREEEVAKVFRRWGLQVAAIGEVTSTGRAVLVWHGETVADMPVLPLTQEAPVYRRPVEPPADLAARQRPPEVPLPADPMGDLRRLLATPELASKQWIWRQYDHTVRTNTVAGPGGDAAVLLLKGTPSGLAMTSDVNPVYCYLDPRRGGAQAVAEAVRNLACVGAEPVGLTDCLNFGNPERPEITWQFREAIRGMSEACRALGAPVISGNVSFYNETEGRSIHPTPTVGMVGVIPDLRHLPEACFLAAEDRILLLGNASGPGEFGGSAYLRLLHDVEQGLPPAVDLGAEARLAALLRRLVAEGLIHTAHDLSEGGLAIALAEACFGRLLGAEVTVPLSPVDLFSETQGRAIVAARPFTLEKLLRAAEEAGVPALPIGVVGGSDLVVRADGETLRSPVAELHEIWSTALPKALGL